MKLNSNNYFSKEAQMEYFSVSQYKDFVGTIGMVGCEAQAVAKLRGEWEQEMTTPLLVGSFVDAHFEGTLDVFTAQYPQILKKDGGLRAEYTQAEEIIARIERDEYFMKYLSGKKQVIFTGDIFGVKWKCKVDSFIKDLLICDLKVMASLRKSFWAKDYGSMEFVSYWGYDTQAAVYQKLVEINTGKVLPFYIAGASKEKYPDIEIIGFNQVDLDGTLSLIEPNIKRISQLKKGELAPDRCEVCDYCKHTKVLNKPIHFTKLLLKI